MGTSGSPREATNPSLVGVSRGMADKFNAGHYHEVMDRAALMMSTWEREVENIDATQAHSELRAAAEKAGAVLVDFYQLAGLVYFALEEEEERQQNLPSLRQRLKDAVHRVQREIGLTDALDSWLNFHESEDIVKDLASPDNMPGEGFETERGGLFSAHGTSEEGRLVKVTIHCRKCGCTFDWTM